MNFATALRQGVMERIHKYAFWLQLPLLGFDPLMIFTMMSISLFYRFWLRPVVALLVLIFARPGWRQSAAADLRIAVG